MCRARLNLSLEQKGRHMKIGDTINAKIAPTDSSGQPAPVSGVTWTVNPAGAFTIVPAADGLSAVYTAAVNGTGNVCSVAAKSAAGVLLHDAKPLPDVVAPQPEATALNLTVG